MVFKKREKNKNWNGIKKGEHRGFAIDNGRTLCEDCHKKTDTYGRKKQ